MIVVHRTIPGGRVSLRELDPGQVDAAGVGAVGEFLL